MIKGSICSSNISYYCWAGSVSFLLYRLIRELMFNLQIAFCLLNGLVVYVRD